MSDRKYFFDLEENGVKYPWYGNKYLGSTLHAGKPSMRKSEKIIFLTKAYNVGLTTDKGGAWLHLEGKIIKS